jgi:hypothetical protein
MVGVKKTKKRWVKRVSLSWLAFKLLLRPGPDNVDRSKNKEEYSTAYAINDTCYYTYTVS